MSGRGHGRTNITGRPRFKQFKQIVPEKRASLAMARFKRDELRKIAAREILAARQILLIVYPMCPRSL